MSAQQAFVWACVFGMCALWCFAFGDDLVGPGGGAA